MMIYAAIGLVDWLQRLQDDTHRTARRWINDLDLKAVWVCIAVGIESEACRQGSAAIGAGQVRFIIADFERR